jgi:hypothetical protein
LDASLKFSAERIDRAYATGEIWRSDEDNAGTNLDCPGPEDAGCHLGPSSTPHSKDIRDDAAQLPHRNQLSSAATDSACGELRALPGACHSPHFSHPSLQQTGNDRICS